MLSVSFFKIGIKVSKFCLSYILFDNVSKFVSHIYWLIMFQTWLPSIKELKKKKKKRREIWWVCDTYIGVELANEAGEVVVFEIVGEKVPSELGGSPNDEGGVVFAPRDYVVGGRVVYKLVCFGKERCRNWFVCVQRQQNAFTVV